MLTLIRSRLARLWAWVRRLFRRCWGWARERLRDKSMDEFIATVDRIEAKWKADVAEKKSLRADLAAAVQAREAAIDDFNQVVSEVISLRKNMAQRRERIIQTVADMHQLVLAWEDELNPNASPVVDDVGAVDDGQPVV